MDDRASLTAQIDAYAARFRTDRTGGASQRQLSPHLRALESEAIYILREVAAEFERPVMLYSIGKDSTVMLHLAMKAFWPAKPPFPFLHIDSLWEFQAMGAFRDALTEALGLNMIVWVNEDGRKQNIDPFVHGSALHTQVMRTEGLLQSLNAGKYDAAFGGGRRDEEKSRAKERVFSFRNEHHAWDPRNQRPELWRTFNTKIRPGESIRVFPLSNWTEVDIWQYILEEQVPIVPLYFAGERPVVERDGTLIMVDDDRMKLKPDETAEMKRIRFRTLGCYPLTGAVESDAETLEDIVLEMLTARSSERAGRLIDFDEQGSMEKKKREGYF